MTMLAFLLILAATLATSTPIYLEDTIKCTATSQQSIGKEIILLYECHGEVFSINIKDMGDTSITQHVSGTFTYNGTRVLIQSVYIFVDGTRSWLYPILCFKGRHINIILSALMQMSRPHFLQIVLFVDISHDESTFISGESDTYSDERTMFRKMGYSLRLRATGYFIDENSQLRKSEDIFTSGPCSTMAPRPTLVPNSTSEIRPILTSTLQEYTPIEAIIIVGIILGIVLLSSFMAYVSPCITIREQSG